MINKYVSRLKLMAWLAGAVALCAGGVASAGILYTVDVLKDFSISEDATVDYHPDVRSFNTLSEPGLRYSTTDGVELYLGSEVASDGSSRLRFDVERTDYSGGTATTQKLLGGVIASMQSDRGAGRFDFLVADGNVTGDLAGKAGGNGVYLGLSGFLGDSRWDVIYNSLKNPVSSQSSVGTAGGSGVPAAPAPGTLALLLAAAVPLFRTRRRG
jgi:hypothetical protein